MAHPETDYLGSLEKMQMLQSHTPHTHTTDTHTTDTHTTDTHTADTHTLIHTTDTQIHVLYTTLSYRHIHANAYTHYTRVRILCFHTPTHQ